MQTSRVTSSESVHRFSDKPEWARPKFNSKKAGKTAQFSRKVKASSKSAKRVAK